MKTSTERKSAPKKPKPDDPKQSQRFVETARNLAIEENEKAFERTISVIIPASRQAPSPKILAKNRKKQS